ncbi:hypothetical protein NQ314_018543 [Rhamnusium bicolor]|uniref:Peptidase aspartic putative domain-containing protein n=1 Tax=Rhamnusium bicolor TaxID=1586634 RepID=A0AAV8WRS7_9CUCU|nr:hypothetical protein NQ314_018543 [Rhamnusium bicolor]
MHYLAGALKGRALDVCASVVPTPENYVVFWETLVSKYQDDRLLADIYFSQMLDFKTAHQESAACLNNFLEKFDTSVNAIKHLNIPDLLDFFIASLALSKLDSQTRKLFEMSKHSEIPTYKEIIDFVKNQRKALMIDKVTDRLPTTKIPVKSLSYLRHIQLADEQFYEPSKIDGIIGASLFLHILGNSKVVGPPNLPMAVQTSLGYIVMGNVPTPTIMEVANSQTFCSIIKPSLEQILHKFWEIEEIPAPPVLNQEDAECENIFITTTTREETGRFTVALPFKEYPPVTIKQLASDEADKFPFASKVVETDLYIDDLVVSVPAVPEAIELYHQLVRLFSAGGFELNNIADCLSRGLTPAPFIEHSAWLSGPHWLKLETDKWPIQHVAENNSLTSEEKITVVLPTIVDEYNPLRNLMLRISSWSKLCRITVFTQLKEDEDNDDNYDEEEKDTEEEVEEEEEEVLEKILSLIN